MHHALSLPPFGELSDPFVLMDLAAAAEANGWDAVFVWDHLLRPLEQATFIADPWIMMSAIATAELLVVRRRGVNAGARNPSPSPSATTRRSTTR